MKQLYSIPIVLALAFFQPAAQVCAQTPSNKNAIHAKLNFFDYGLLNDEELKIGEGFELGYFRNIAPYFNLGVPLKFGLARLPGESGNLVTSSADLVGQFGSFKPEAKVMPYAFGGVGYFLEDFSRGHVQIPFGAGAHFKVARYAYINAQAEMRLAMEERRNNVQLGLGFKYLLHRGEPKYTPPTDSDGDGTPDNIDMCPDQPGPAATLGCPDSDGDGIVDADDACPEEPGTLDTNGCPDTDGDGVPDKDDRCPNQPGRLNGCPDADNDGIPDDEDMCPNEPGPASNRGCPAKKDSDGDGFPDDVDECPDKPGPYGGCPDTDGDGLADNVDRCPDEYGTDGNGCPEIKQETKDKLARVTKNVQFESGSTRLTKASLPVLDELVGIMEQYPQYYMMISGHTDNSGNPDSNLRLSEQRAQACFDYLISRGAPPLRLRYTGYGDSRPIADNATAAGRQLNRRVAFELQPR